MAERQPIVVGNWKMHGLAASLVEIEALVDRFGSDAPAIIIVCPPFTLLSAARTVVNGSGIKVGAQDCYMSESGAHTGDISAQMLGDVGASVVIVGHSERRADHAESDALVKAKAEAALKAGLTPIICVGETLDQREAGEGNAEAVVLAQLADSLPSAGDYYVAYEPVWAIGTGKVPTNNDLEQMHDTIRQKVGAQPPILYGGSVKPGNAAELSQVTNIDGFLVGGASLTAESFGGIIAVYA